MSASLLRATLYRSVEIGRIWRKRARHVMANRCRFIAVPALSPAFGVALGAQGKPTPGSGFT
jgi:hypothetical protein